MARSAPPLSRALASASALLLLLAGCRRPGGHDRGDPAPASSASPAVAASTSAAPIATAGAAGSASAAGAPAPRPPATPPEGYMPMTVMTVAMTERGDAVLLVGGEDEVVLPIFIGGTEALSIRLRLEGDRFKRPLTHDLLDTLVLRMGGDVWKVHVDDLRESTFVGTVFVRQGERVIEVDARPSDAIALALGNKVPIFVSRAVATSAGLRKRDLEKQQGGLEVPPGQKEPLAL